MSSVTPIPIVLPVDAAVPPWTFDHLSTVEEALTTLSQVLQYKGALSANKPIRQTQLRPLMGAANEKFFGSAATTHSSGMIALLLRIAAMRGLVELGGDPGDYLVWMKTRDKTETESISPASTTETSPAFMTVVAPVQKVQGVLQRIPSAPAERRSRHPEKYRSDLYSDRIGKARMGPFPAVRRKLYSALDSLVNSEPKRSLLALVEAAINIIKEDVPAGQPWEAIRNVTQRQLLKAQVAFDESDNPLPDRWQSGGRIVHRLASEWQVRAEGEILMALFEAENVTGNDIANVCRSVWGSSSSEAQAAFFSIMQYLTDRSRVVEEDKNGVFRVKRQPMQGDDHPQPALQPLERAPVSPADDVPVQDEPKSILQ